MRLRLLPALAALLALLLAAPGPAAAQELPVVLLADRVTYDPRSETLTAEGHVEVFYQDNRLQARRIVYDARSGTVTAEGPVRLESGDGIILLADLTQLTPDFRDGLIEGARLLVNDQLQLAAVEGRRSEGRFTSFNKIVGSSCRVCAAFPTPIWQIRAENVVHDNLEQQFHFQNAWFDLYGVPIAYFPYLRIPDPSLGRASGFLLPQFASSDLWGYGIKLPYYMTLGDHADITLTPFVTSRRAAILEAEYRQNFARGSVRVESALSFADADTGRDFGVGSGAGRGYVFADGTYDLGRDYRADVEVQLATDNAFLQQFDYSDADRLTSRAHIRRFRNREFLDINVAGYQSLRDEEDQATIPFVLPQVEYRNVWTDLPFGGRMGVTGDGLNLRRQDGRDMLRLGAGFDWRGDATLRNGIQLAAFAETQFDYYSVRNDPAAADGSHFRVTPTTGAEIRWPFAKRAGRALHVIEPVAQLFYTAEPENAGLPNEDSLLPELDETNVFLANRFPGRDAHEDGLRANIGVNYTFYDSAGWNAGITVGQVIRAEASSDFTSGSGLADTHSDLVLAGSIESGRGRLLGRALLDDGYSFRRQDFEFAYSSERFEATGSYVYLAADSSNPIIGPVPEREEIGLAASYQINDNWGIGGEYRYDIATDRPVSAEGALSYGNECIKLDLSVSRRFTSSDNVPEDIQYGFGVKFAGLGGDSGETWPSDRCKAGWRQ